MMMIMMMMMMMMMMIVMMMMMTHLTIEGAPQRCSLESLPVIKKS